MKTKLATTSSRHPVAALFAVLGAVFACATASAESAPAKREEPLKVALFPLEGVNVSSDVAASASEFLAAALQKRSVTLVDTRAAVARAFSQTPLAPTTSLPPATSQPTNAAPSSPPPAPLPPTGISRTRAEISRAAGANAFIEGCLVRLGSRGRVSVELRSVNGALMRALQAETDTDAGLAAALEKMAMAFAGDEESAAALGLARNRPTKPASPRRRVEANFGATGGVLVAVNESQQKERGDLTALLAFDARLDIGRALVGVNAGFGFSDDDGSSDPEEVDAHFFVNLLVAYYLSSGSIAPFLGAGVGFFVGYRLGDWDVIDDSGESGPGGDLPPFGFTLFPTFGVEFLRNARTRCHVDIRYSFDFASGRYGHGPIALFGFDF